MHSPKLTQPSRAEQGAHTFSRASLFLPQPVPALDGFKETHEFWKDPGAQLFQEPKLPSRGHFSHTRVEQVACSAFVHNVAQSTIRSPLHCHGVLRKLIIFRQLA